MSKPEPIRAKIIRLVEAGRDATAIAEEIGHPVQYVRHELCRLRSLGRIAAEATPAPVFKKDIVLRMALDGATLQEICKEIGSDEKSALSIVYRLRRELTVAITDERDKAPQGSAFRRHESVARAQLAMRTAGGGKDVPDDMRAQIDAFDKRLIKRIPTMYAFGAEAQVPSITNNAVIRAAWCA